MKNTQTFRLNDTVIHKIQRCAGSVIGFGYVIRCGIYLPSLKVWIPGDHTSQEGRLIEDWSLLWYPAG